MYLLLLILLFLPARAHAIGPLDGRCLVPKADLEAERAGLDVRKITSVSGSILTYQAYRGPTPLGAPATMHTGEMGTWRQVPCPKRGKGGKMIERSYEKRAKARAAREGR